MQALAFSGDGQILFSSAGHKETAVSSLLVNEEQIISVEFGGFSSSTETTEGTGARNDDLGGDVRIMGIDVLDCVPCWEPGYYLVALVLSDSNIKVLSPKNLMIVVLFQSTNEAMHPRGLREVCYMLPLRVQILNPPSGLFECCR